LQAGVCTCCWHCRCRAAAMRALNAATLLTMLSSMCVLCDAAPFLRLDQLYSRSRNVGLCAVHTAERRCDDKLRWYDSSCTTSLAPRNPRGSCRPLSLFRG
jgi:hypothetical protein